MSLISIKSIELSFGQPSLLKNISFSIGSNERILGFGRLEMGLGYGCLWYQYVVVHEILHSLGFQHEQKRPDKDDYIQMRWDNIRVC